MNFNVWESSSPPPTPSGRAIDPNLLSPPVPANCFDSPPFKPATSDQTSLSMKNRRQRRNRRHREGLDRASTGDTQERSRSVPSPRLRNRLASTSVPDLQNETTSQPFPSAAGQLLMRQQLRAIHMAHQKDTLARSAETRRRASLPQRRRRWTMPSKATSTRVVSEAHTPITTTAILSSNDQPDTSRSKSEAGDAPQSRLSSSWQGDSISSVPSVVETPAVITLRRATVQRGPSPVSRRASLRPNAIVSFPPPKFNRTTSAYFSSLFGLNSARDPSKNDEPVQTSVRQSSWSTGQDSNSSTQRASVSADRVHLTSNTTVIPAFTKVEFIPLSQAHAEQQELVALSARRCSTTIVSGSSVHEIIWDENISSSGGSTSPENSRRASRSNGSIDHPPHHRQQSVLVEKLESQLRHSDGRKASGGSSVSNDSRASSDFKGRNQSEPQKLTNWDLRSPQDTNQRRHASSSRALKPALKHDIWPTIKEPLDTLEDATPFPPGSELVEFFPPIEGKGSDTRRSSLAHSNSPLREVKRVSIEEPLAAFTHDAPHLAGPSGKSKGKARSTSFHSPQVRKTSVSTHHPTMGTAIGCSAHVRRRSSTLERSAASDRSRRTIDKTPSREHARPEESTPLLGNGEHSNQYLWPTGSPGGQAVQASVLQPRDLTTLPPKTGGKTCVHKTERMKWACSAGELICDDPATAGLVRRDSPWMPQRRFGAGAAETGSGRGKVLSEVGEEGGILGIQDDGVEVAE